MEQKKVDEAVYEGARKAIEIADTVIPLLNKSAVACEQLFGTRISKEKYHEITKNLMEEMNRMADKSGIGPRSAFYCYFGSVFTVAGLTTLRRFSEEIVSEYEQKLPATEK